MAEHEFRLPKIGMQMTEATIEEWKVADGATVEEGQEIATISTDKVDAELESPVGGVIRIVAGEGETIEVGVLVAVITS